MPWTCITCGYRNFDDAIWCENCEAKTPVYDPLWQQPPSQRANLHFRAASGLGPPGVRARRWDSSRPTGSTSSLYQNARQSFHNYGQGTSTDFVPNRSRSRKRNLKLEPLFPPSWDQSQFPDNGAASAASAASSANAAPDQRNYPIFHPHPLNRVFLPPGSRRCDRCQRDITDSSSWKCANGCDVDLCNACDAEAVQAGSAAHAAYASAAAPAAAAAANQDPDLNAAIAASIASAAAAAAAPAANQDPDLNAAIAASIASAAAAAAAASNEPGSVASQASSSNQSRASRASSAAERNNVGQPGVVVNEASQRGTQSRHQNGFVPNPSPPPFRSAENIQAAANRATARQARLAREAAAARVASAASAEASAAGKAAARVRADNQRQQANNALKDARQRSRDLALARYQPQPPRVNINYRELLDFLNEFAGDIGGNFLMTLKQRLQAAVASWADLTIPELTLLRKSVVLVSARFIGSELDRTHPGISNEARGRLDAVFIMLNMMKDVIDASIERLSPPPKRGGTRRRARHTKNKTGRKRRTHRR